MTIYQKAIKLRKECESRNFCKGCKYLDKCEHSVIFFLSPANAKLTVLAKIIKEEKWNIK